MPSPIAHIAAGYLVWNSGRESLTPPGGRFSSLVGVGTFAFLSLLPDADAVPGLLFQDLGRFHNHFSHSFFAGLASSLMLMLAAKALGRTQPARWLTYGLICYWIHLAMDFMTVGRGVMLFWPLSNNRFSSPVKLFSGLHWSEGLWSLRHLETILTEVLLVLFVFLLFAALRRGGLLRPASRGKG